MNLERRDAGLTVFLSQQPCIVGDLAGNVKRIVKDLRLAKFADLFITPELSICGYPPEDLLNYSDFIESCEIATKNLTEQAAQVAPGVHLGFGMPIYEQGKLFNALRVVCDGKIVATAYKMNLPNYGVFDEKRYFAAGVAPTVTEIAGRKVGLAICHDIWNDSLTAALAGQDLDLIIVTNASPFVIDKQLQREIVTEKLAQTLDCEVAYVNYTGGQDEHIFDGGSHYRSPTKLIYRLGNQPATGLVTDGQITQLLSPIAQLRTGLVTALRSYFASSGCSKAFIGLSGGIDSAVVACLATEALGAENVTSVLMSSRYTAKMSIEDAESLTHNLGIGKLAIGIDEIFEVMLTALTAAQNQPLEPIANENLQSRIRGMLLMALANHHSGLVITTSNKSEMATGFSTIYGDMAGAYSLLKDVSKQLVYELANYINSQQEIIPQRTIDREPSAELRDNQLDSDTLPDYNTIDKMLESIVEKFASPKNLVQEFGSETVSDFLRRLRYSEFKRRQAPIGPTVTSRAFGKDWRMPVSNDYIFRLKDDE